MYLHHGGSDDCNAASVRIGAGGVEWIPLYPACTPVTALIYILVSIYTAMATIYMTLTYTIVTQDIAISTIYAMYVAFSSTLMFRPPA